jgi:hypothetical protein
MRLYLQFPLLHTRQLYTFSVFQPQHYNPACSPVNMLPTYRENVYCELRKTRKGTFRIRYCHFQRCTRISVCSIPLCYINRIKKENVFFQHNIITKQTFLELIFTITVIINSFHTCIVHFDVIKSSICPTNAQLNCFKMFKTYIKICNKCSYIFRFNQTIIREPTVCASLKLQYWRQLKYFVIELFGRVCIVHSAQWNSITLHCARYTYQQDWINMRPHDKTVLQRSILTDANTVTLAKHRLYAPWLWFG